MAKRPITDIFEQMEKYKDTVFLIGDKAINRDTSNLNSEILNNKTLRRDPESFWNYYLHHVVLNENEPLTFSQKTIMQFITLGYGNKIINLTHMNQNKLGTSEVINLHGLANSFKCTKCKTLYTIDYIEAASTNKRECECCGKPIRPEALLDGESYFDNDFNKAKEWLLETHTVFAIGIDWGESPIASLLADYADMKEERNKREKEKRLIVIVGEDELTPNMDEIALFDFIARGDVNESMKRLIELKKNADK